jgi:hypothetical protein
MEQSNILVPYKDLSANWQSGGSIVRLELPWMTCEVEVDDQNKDWVQQALTDLKQNSKSPSAQKFLRQLEDYPISYVASRSQVQLREPKDNQLLRNIDVSSPRALAKTLNPNLDLELPKAWNWPLVDIFSKAQMGSSSHYDPLTLVTYLIGERLNAESQTDQIRIDLPQNLDVLRQKDEAQFFEIMKKIIRQTHYITNHLQECVQPALTIFKEARPLIQQFMDEERGHDRLMINALKELGCEHADEVEPFASTILVMDLFKKAAEESPLAFTLMIGHFEGSSFEETDPLADVLARSSRPAAATGYAIHHEINTEEQHNKVIYDLAPHLGCQSEPEVTFAARALELATILGAMGNHKLYNMSKEKIL